MKIAVLAWGSLVWNPRNLQTSEKWHHNGPLLPVEFAKLSQDGRLTLVLYPEANKVEVLWAMMSIETLNEAIENLRKRERTPNVNNIGFVDLNIQRFRSNIILNMPNILKDWASKKGIDAVIWTDLPPKFESITGIPLNGTNVISYLANLKHGEKQVAEEYVRNTPAQIKTKFRTRIEQKLGWTAMRESDG